VQHRRGYEVHFIQDVICGSELNLFSTEFFLVRSRREMWVAMESKDMKFTWLKIRFEKHQTLNLKVRNNPHIIVI
jgi:hypothetical protein